MKTPVTLGVLGAQMEQMQITLEEIKTNLKTVNDQALDRRVTSLESTVTWLSRVLIGAIVTAMVSGAFAFVLGK